jgi:hypothetical protein
LARIFALTAVINPSGTILTSPPGACVSSLFFIGETQLSPKPTTRQALASTLCGGEAIETIHIGRFPPAVANYLFAQRAKFRAFNNFYEKSGQPNRILSFREWLDLPF